MAGHVFIIKWSDVPQWNIFKRLPTASTKVKRLEQRPWSVALSEFKTFKKQL